MTAFQDPASQPDPASHLLSEFGYASLPPPPSATPSGAASDLATPDALPNSSLHERFAPQWVDLLRRAVEEPGLISEAYTRFHGYSLGNRFAALLQCQERGLEPGPISTFNGWRKLGYAVQKGEEAITLCMPLKGVMAREKPASPADQAQHPSAPPDIQEIEYIRAFVWKPHWFVLAQTQPVNPETVQPVSVPTLPGWDKEKALAALGIHEKPFTALDGNIQGYAHERDIAVSPLAALPHKTFFHEAAHVVLGHTEGPNSAGRLIDTLTLSRSQSEVEAEGTALLLLDVFDLPGQEYARGYIQHWLEGEAIPEKSAQRIFGAADRILSAGLGELRPRHPTADDLGWPEGGSTATNGSAATSSAAPPVDPPVVPPATPSVTTPARAQAATAQATTAQAAPFQAATVQATSLAAPALNGSPRFPAAHPEPQEEERATLPPVPAPHAPAVASRSAPVEVVPVEAAPNGATTERVPRDGAEAAWKLHERLKLSHGELHPAEKAERGSVAHAMRHLEHLDPEATFQVRELVSSASRCLKAAFSQIELTLESTLDSSTWRQGEAKAEAQGVDPQGVEPQAALSGVLFTPDPAPLSPTREAAARRTVGRDLRQELQAEKRGFFEAAKEQGLKIGGKHEKAMLAALSEFFGVPVTSRRDLTSRQWAQAASAIQTEDLRW